LKALEVGKEVVAVPVEEEKPVLTVKQAFKLNEVICMVCGRGGFKTLARHLNKVHGMKPGEHKK
jgi:predicted transcriptional regulator